MPTDSVGSIGIKPRLGGTPKPRKAGHLMQIRASLSGLWPLDIFIFNWLDHW